MKIPTKIAACVILSLSFNATFAAKEVGEYVLKTGAPSLKVWELLATPPYPADNAPTRARIELGKMLYFDPHLSRDGDMSCATCHNPSLGWSDGLGRARGFQNKLLDRALPSIINTAYNNVHMWDDDNIE